jgi:hypothetical protein
MTRPIRLGIALVVGFTFAAAACGGDDDSDAAAGAGGELAIEVTAPAEGAAVGASFELAADTTVPLGEPDTGLHHMHLYYDGNRSDGEYDIVYGNSATVTGLTPGEHTIDAVIANADHSLTDAEARITVMVEEGGAATDDAPPTAGEDRFDY